jgi:hypothetical protein
LTPPPSIDTPTFSAEDWTRFLSGQLGRRVQVRFGHARRQVIVAFPEASELRVRMNSIFGRAPQPVRKAVADWLRSGRSARRACAELDGWIASIVTKLGPPRPPRLVTRGQHHDLAEIAGGLLAREFAHLLPERRPAGITWGRRGSRSARRSLQLGSFDPETALIRIHPVLDQAAVPRWFVRYVLFHELLHADLSDEGCGDGKRTRHHGPRFRRREMEYPDTRAAIAWQEKHLSALLRSARSGRAMPVPAPRRMPSLRQGWLFELS